MAADVLTPWSWRVTLSDAQRAPVRLSLTADEETRRRVATDLDLQGVESLSAEVTVDRWQDGLVVRADWRARVGQTCGVTLEDFMSDLRGAFEVRAVPPDSPLAAYQEPEAEISLETPDPPDVLDGDAIDVAALVLEHLALEIDPYPRKPGATFEPPEEPGPESPFSALAALKPKGSG